MSVNKSRVHTAIIVFLLGLVLLAFRTNQHFEVGNDDGDTGGAAGSDVRTAQADLSEEGTFVTSLRNPCSFSDRRKHVMDVCSELPEVELQRHHTESPNFYAMIIDHQKKVLYCRIGKSGSTAAVRYFRSFNTKSTTGFSDLPRYTWNQTSAKQRSELKGFQYFEDMPVDEFEKYYSDYKKILFVRHPIQRIVSSFFFSCIRNRKPSCHMRTNFTEFIRDVILQSDHLAKIIYRTYNLACHPCTVQYDMIVRTETSDDDMPRVNEEIGANSTEHSLPYVMVNTNDTINEDFEAKHYKYNEFLAKFQSENPELFQEMLRHFALDFRMFGYTWENQRSGCFNKFEDCC